MGYYTDYTINSDDGLMEELHLDNIRELSGYEWFTEVKWYDNERDMKTYSKLHPIVLFSVEYDGEEQGDVGIKYFKNGKMQNCKAITTFEPFDETKLS